MGKSYSEEEVNSHLKDDMFYRKECLNWKGKIKGKDDKYYNYIAKWLYEKSDDEIKRLLGSSDMSPYEGDDLVENDNSKIDYNDGEKNYNKRHEEKVTKRLVQKGEFNDKYENTTIKCLYYQIPVNRQDASKHGKVDLVMENNKEDLIICELKDNDSDETLLRAMVEIYTYYIKIKENIVRSKKENKKYSPEFLHYMENHKNIIPAVMFFKSYDNEPRKEFDEMNNNKSEEGKNYLYRLAKKWNIQFYSIKDTSVGDGDGKQLKPKDYLNENYEIVMEKI